MGETCDPLAEGEPAGGVQSHERPHVPAGIPEVQTLLVPPALEGWLWYPGEPIVDEEPQIEAALDEQRIRSREPRVALDDLELAIPMVALELDVPETQQPHVAEHLLAQIAHFGVPVCDVIAAGAPVLGVAADDPLGEIAKGGPTSSTKLDKCFGIVEFDYLTVVASIACQEEKWAGEL